MSDCKHNFIEVKTNFCSPFWMCEHCEMELPRNHYEALQQAHREGWEQGKREAVEIMRNRSLTFDYVDRLEFAIAAMKYKEKEID